jgi:hypothetical protein
MKIELTDPLKLTNYGPSTSGNFFQIKPGDNSLLSSRSCREDFEKDWITTNYHNRIAFQKSKLNIELAMGFLNKIFDKLGKTSKFELRETNIQDMIVVDIPEFWMKNDTVRGLFSLFLRNACVYYKPGDSLMTAFARYNLAAMCIPTILHFLDGNIIPTYEKLTGHNYGATGFVSEYYGLIPDEISKRLVSKI